MLTSIVGINWGDEGKGRMVDLLSQKYDVVVRYQGGNNAGHTVINDKGKFVLNLMPSGILRDETVNVLGPGMVIDTEHMFHEVARLREGGITITPEHLKISDKAVICMPYHKLLDCLEEDRLADKKFGSTRRGISPAYSDKYMKKALRMGELADRDALKDAITQALAGADALVTLYNLAPLGEYEVNFNFGDVTYNYEEDKASWRAYVMQGWVPKWMYFVKFEGMSEEEAKAMTAEADAAQIEKAQLFGAE